MSWRCFLGWVLVAVAFFVVDPGTAFAGSKLDITSMIVPEEGGAKLEKRVRALLYKAAKPLKFGKKKVEATFKMTELSTTDEDDHIRISCTLVGRLKGGGTARSHISFGGARSKRLALERQVLIMVSEGVMGRLAQLARERDAAEERKARAGDGTSKVSRGEPAPSSPKPTEPVANVTKKALPRPSRRAMR